MSPCPVREKCLRNLTRLKIDADLCTISVAAFNAERDEEECTYYLPERTEQ